MAKQIIHIGIAVSTDGVLPERSNIINLAGSVGPTLLFNQNIIPQNGRYGESNFWSKHPEEFGQLQRSPIPLAVAMTEFRKWLAQFQGTLVACTSSIDHWHLLKAMFSTGRDCPFGLLPIDVNTLAMVMNGHKRPTKITEVVVPLAVAKERWALVTSGRMPTFGQRGVPKVAKKKSLFTDPPPWDWRDQAIANTTRRRIPTPPIRLPDLAQNT